MGLNETGRVGHEACGIGHRDDHGRIGGGSGEGRNGPLVKPEIFGGVIVGGGQADGDGPVIFDANHDGVGWRTAAWVEGDVHVLAHDGVGDNDVDIVADWSVVGRSSRCGRSRDSKLLVSVAICWSGARRGLAGSVPGN